MSGMVVMSLGPHIFYVPLPDHDTPSFETMDRDATYTWIASQRLSRKPAMQFSGPGEETITINGRLFPNQFGGLSTIEGLRESASEGKVLTLMRYYPLGEPKGMAGVTIGRYGIKRVRTSESKIGSNNVANKIDFTIEMVEYGEDNERSQGIFISGTPV